MADDTQIPLPTACMHGVGDFLGEERAAATRVAAISARRSEMAREALAVQAQLARLAQAANEMVEEALGDLIKTARDIRVPDGTTAAVSWLEVEAVLTYCVAAMAEYRRTLAPVPDLAGRVIGQMVPLLKITAEEVEQRAEHLMEAQTSALLAQAATLPLQ